MVDDLGSAERLIDAMAVSWGKSPDYMAQRFDGWCRAGATVPQIQDAFDYVERKRVEPGSRGVDDPVALMHVRLRGNQQGGMRKVGVPSLPRPPEGIDTHDPDAVPPRMIWVRTDAPCNACELTRRGMRSSQVANVAHTCGEMVSYAKVNKVIMEVRREEARSHSECSLCWGAGVRWSYEASQHEILDVGGRKATFQDRRGVRGLVLCACQRGRS